jgi:hypothetical protein
MRVALVLFVLCGATSAVAVKVPTFYARQDYPGNGQVAVGDLNGDKIPDVISMFGYVINTLLGNGDGTFRVGPTTKPGIPINYFVTADLNGDGPCTTLSNLICVLEAVTTGVQSNCHLGGGTACTPEVDCLWQLSHDDSN